MVFVFQISAIKPLCSFAARQFLCENPCAPCAEECGLDEPGNMQWQTVADGKAKDKGGAERLRKIIMPELAAELQAIYDRTTES